MTMHNSILRTFSILLLVVMISCENDITVVNSLTVDGTTPIESSYDVNMEYTDSGRLVMIMRTPEANRYPAEEEYTEMPKGVSLVFYDSLGNIKSDLSSEYAINYIDKKMVEARINVIVTTAKGDKLYTELLIWDQKKKTIYTDAPVRIIEDGLTVYGDGLVSDETFDVYTITNSRAVFDMEYEGDSINDSDETSPQDNTSVKKQKSIKPEEAENKEKIPEEDDFSDFDKY